MSNSGAGDFWSKLGQKRGVIAPSPAPAPTPAPAKPEESKLTEASPAQASPAKKPGPVSKSPDMPGAGNPAVHPSSLDSSSVTATKAHFMSTSWADSVEEDMEADMEANSAVSESVLTVADQHDYAEDAKATISEQQKHIEEQEKCITEQLVRIEEQQEHIEKQEECIVEQQERIEELELDVQNKAELVLKLEDRVRNLEQCLDDMDSENHQRDTCFEELTQELADKTRHTQELQKDLVSTVATLRELELQVAENVRAPPSDSSTEIGDAVEDRMHVTNTTSEQSPAPIAPGVAQATDSSKPLGGGGDCVLLSMENTDVEATGLSANLDTPAKAPTTPPAQEGFPALSSVDFPALGSPPSSNVFQQTVFVTADRIKKVPPPPPARKLTLGIDPSKFQKKIPQPQPTTARRLLYTSRHGSSATPAIDPGKDIRRMSKEEREPLGYGPTVQIFLDNKMVATVPKYGFMHVSLKAFKYWNENPNATSMKFEAGAFTLDALSIQLEWITMHTYCNKVFSVNLKPEAGDRQNLELFRCARALGLHPMYMGHFTRMYCDQIRKGPSFELIFLIEELTWDDADPIFECLANNWLLNYSKAKSEAIPAWESKLTCLPRLAAKIQDVRSRKNSALGGARGSGQGKPKENERPSWENDRPNRKNQNQKNQKNKQSQPSTKAAEEVPALTATADADPDAAWRASGPSYM